MVIRLVMAVVTKGGEATMAMRPGVMVQAALGVLALFGNGEGRAWFYACGATSLMTFPWITVVSLAVALSEC